MAHANSVTGSSVYIGDGTDGMVSGDGIIPEDTFTSDGWPTTIRFTGPGDTFGSGIVIDIDSDA
jgi:hypothetical protein